MIASKPTRASTILLLDILVSIFCGFIFSCAIHAYLLIDLFPITSRRLAFLTILIFVVVLIASFFVLKRVRSFICNHPELRTGKLITISLIAGIVFLIVGSDEWQQSHRYFTFFLPTNTIAIKYNGNPIPDQSISLTWFSTSVGEVSFDSMEKSGWEREGDQLILQDSASNQILWKGKTGEQITLVFSGLSQESEIFVSINGTDYWQVFQPGTGNEQIFTSHIPVFFFASRWIAVISTILSLAILVFLFLILTIPRSSNLIRSSMYLTDTSIHRKASLIKRSDWILMLGMVVIAVLIRAYHLDALPPYTDEYIHLNTAKLLISGSPINTVYQRGMYIVTLPVAFFFKVFGLGVFQARIVGVIINSLAIVPLYLLMRKINKPTAILSALLYATNPWVIAIARNVREYAFYPFYFYWIIYLIVINLESFPRRINKSFFSKTHIKWFVTFILLILPIVYGLFIDRLSTFKIIFIAYAIYFLLLLFYMEFDVKDQRLPRFLIIGIGLLLGLLFISKQNFISIALPNSAAPLHLFFPNPLQQWYFNRVNIIPLTALIMAVYVGIKIRSQNIIPLFLFLKIIFYVIFFTFLFDRYFRPRYIVTLEYWFIPLLAYGLNLILLFIHSVVRKKKYTFVIAALMFASFLNPAQTFFSMSYSKAGIMPITDEYHYDLKMVDDYLVKNSNSSDALISTIYKNHVAFYGRPTFSAIESFDYTQEQPLQEHMEFMTIHPNGWIVLDIHRGAYRNKSVPRETFSIGDTRIEFIGRFNDQLVWKWETKLRE